MEYQSKFESYRFLWQINKLFEHHEFLFVIALPLPIDQSNKPDQLHRLRTVIALKDQRHPVYINLIIYQEFQ